MLQRNPTDPDGLQGPWLSQDEQAAWRHFIFGTRRLMVALDHDLKVHGVSQDDYAVLVALSEADDERLRMADLADLSAQSRSRLSHHIGRLEDRGLIRREACPDDRRGQYAVLTAPGRDLLESVAPHHVASVRAHFLDQISPAELRTIGDAFARIDTRLT